MVENEVEENSTHSHGNLYKQFLTVRKKIFEENEERFQSLVMLFLLQ